MNSLIRLPAVNTAEANNRNTYSPLNNVNPAQREPDVRVFRRLTNNSWFLQSEKERKNACPPGVSFQDRGNHSWRIARASLVIRWWSCRWLNMHDRPPADRRKRRIVNQQRADVQLPEKSNWKQIDLREGPFVVCVFACPSVRDQEVTGRPCAPVCARTRPLGCLHGSRCSGLAAPGTHQLRHFRETF